MLTTIKNKNISLTVCSKGAEIKSLTKNGKEYMWDANPDIWGRTAPILFPLAGALKDKKYRLLDQEYQMSQHGFARDLEFKLVFKTKHKLVYLLKQTEETLLKFPFKFKLYVSYEIKDNNVKVSYKVRNTNRTSMTFSIGAHPGFMISEGYKLKFDGINKFEYRRLTESGLVTNKKFDMFLEETYLPINDYEFADSAIVVEDPSFKNVLIVNKDFKEVLSMKFNSNTFLIWKPVKPGANFICIEPWFGHGDFEDFDGDWNERVSSILLEKNRSFKMNYELEVRE